VKRKAEHLEDAAIARPHDPLAASSQSAKKRRNALGIKVKGKAKG
jgi:hypothetical protein